MSQRLSEYRFYSCHWECSKAMVEKCDIHTTSKVHNPSYREEALKRDRRLQCCPGMGRNKDEFMKVGGSDSGIVAERNHGERLFVWRDAKWPWS
ncbi:hypothetical protein CRYUN_Cryun34aG0047900 [Craigia yunnanensis]